MTVLADGAPGGRIPETGFVLRVFYVFLAIAVLSGIVSVAGKLIGREIAAVGHTQDTHPYEILVGNNVLTVPANLIRFREARRDGDAARLDIYMKWPEMTGYSDADRNAFNHTTESPAIIFATLDTAQMLRDMSGRLEPIYRRLIELPGERGPAGLRVYRFSEDSGYVDERLVIGPVGAGSIFVARCLAPEAAARSLAPCERDIHIGNNLSLTYRFPARLLGNWKALEAAVRAKAAELLAAG